MTWDAMFTEDKTASAKNYEYKKRDDSAIARFKALDTDGDGYISKKEMDMAGQA